MKFPIVETAYLQQNHLLPNGSVRLMGAVDAVTPTSTLVEMDGQKVLVDCGVFENGQLPPEALDAKVLVITHAHRDHIEGLPTLLENGNLKAVYATQATFEIANLLLQDSIRIRGGRGEQCLKFARKFKKVQQPVVYGQPCEPAKGIVATLHEAGHILGSASVQLISQKSRIIISGDLGRPGSPILRDYNTKWDDDQPVDLVLLETTYGSRIQSVNADGLEAQLEKAIHRALKDGGHVLVPTFAIGRAQVLLYLLNTLVEAGRIPDIPVAIDTPLGLKVTRTYTHFEKLYDQAALEKIEKGDDPIDFDTLYFVKKHKDSKRLDELTQPMLILAGSGMCTGGRIIGHLCELLPNPKTNVIFVGYQAHGTPGRVLQKIGETQTAKAQVNPGETDTIDFFGESVVVRARIETLKGISAHADQYELWQWLEQIPKVKKVALHHGDKQSQLAFADYLKKKQADKMKKLQLKKTEKTSKPMPLLLKDIKPISDGETKKLDLSHNCVCSQMTKFEGLVATKKEN